MAAHATVRDVIMWVGPLFGAMSGGRRAYMYVVEAKRTFALKNFNVYFDFISLKVRN